MANSGSFKTSAYDGRYLLFAWEITNQNIQNNTTTISWTLSGAGTASVGYYKAGNFKVVIDGKTVYSSTTRINLYNGTTVKSGTYTFTHNSDGSRSFSASAQAGIYTTAVNCTGSGTFSLTAIPRASTINSVSGNKITDKFSVKYTQYLSSYTNNLKIAVSGYKPSQTITGYQNGAMLQLSDALKKDAYRASQSAQSVNIEFVLDTMNGSSKIGTSNTITKSVAVNDSAPTIDGISYNDTNSKTIAITGDNQKIIRNNSTLSVIVSGMSAKNGATLTKLSLKFGDYNKDVALSGTDASKTVSVGTVNLASDTALTATVTDSRGNTAVTSVNVTMLDYEQPAAMIECKRKENFYSETNLTVNPTIADLDGKNAATITAQYKKSDSSSYGSTVTIPAGETTALTLDNAKSWDVKVIVADKLNTVTYNLYVEKGQPIIFFDRQKSSVGVNCFPCNEESFEISGKDIYKALFYSKGDTINISDVFAPGVLSSNTSELYFSVPIAKSLEEVNGVTVNDMKINARTNGKYALSSAYVSNGYDVLSDSTINVTVTITTGLNAITFKLKKSRTFNGNNNTPVSVQIHSLELTCN